MTCYKRFCSFCGVEIEMSDKNGNWQAFEIITGDFHNCNSIGMCQIQ